MSPTDEEHRYRTILALPLSKSGGLDPLMEALSDESWRVRKAAVDRLVSDAPVELLVPRLIEALADEESASRRSAAMEALIKIGAGAVPAVKAAAAHADAEVRKFALDTLGLMGGEEAVDTVAGAVADADPNVRSAAVEALGRLGTAAAQGALLRILADGAPDLQVAALDALGRCGAAVPLDRLEPALKRRDARRAAVRALGHCPDPGAERAILDALLDRARGVREAALAAWAMKARRRSPSLPPPAGERRDSLIPPALEGLAGADVLAAEGAADLLGCLRAREATEALARAADRDELRTVLRRALREIGPAVLEECQRDFAVLSASGRTLILEVLRDLAGGADPAFHRQAERFALHWIGTTTEQPVRLAAIALLEGVGTAEALAPLADVLGSDPEIDIAAEHALGAAATAAPEGLRALCRARLRSSADVSPALLHLLGKVGTREDQAWLTDLFWRQRLVAPGAAVAALRALRDLGQLDGAILRAASEGADPDLAREGLQAAAAQGIWDVVHAHVAHPRWEVRCEVAAALRQEGGPSAVASLQGMLAREQVPLAAEEERAALEALGARSGP